MTFVFVAGCFAGALVGTALFAWFFLPRWPG